MAIDQLTNGQTGLSVRTILNTLLKRHRYSNVDATPNVIHGYEENAVATNLMQCTIGGGGSAVRENVIGGQEAYVNTATSNLPLDETTTANYSVISGGYDNVANGLASVISGFHNLVAKLASHGTIGGGSVHKIKAGDYNTIGGGYTNTIHSGNSNVISGGNTNAATGDSNSIIGGANGVILASNASMLGGYNNYVEAGGHFAIVGGREARARIYGQRVFAVNKFATNGDAVDSVYLLRGVTTSATPVAISPNAAGAGVLLVLKSIWRYKYTVIAKRSDTEGDMKAWTVEGCATKGSNNIAAEFGTPVKTELAATAGAAAWDVTVTFASGEIVIKGTGEAGASINWLAKLETLELIS